MIGNNIVLGWLWRRVQELGGLGGTLAFLYMSLPPEGKDAVNQIFAGGWQNVSLGAVATIALYLWSQWKSWRSTVRPQVVTADAQQIILPKESVTTAKVEAIAKTAPVPRPRTIIDMIRQRLP
jgi:hypothetical protein